MEFWPWRPGIQGLEIGDLGIGVEQETPQNSGMECQGIQGFVLKEFKDWCSRNSGIGAEKFWGLAHEKHWGWEIPKSPGINPEFWGGDFVGINWGLWDGESRNS